MKDWKPMLKHQNLYSYETRYGKKYGIRKTYYDDAHKRVEYTRSGFDSWREADVVLQRFKTDLDSGKIGNLSTSKITLNDYYNKFRARAITLNIWRPGTVKVKDAIWNKTYLDTLGQFEIGKIKREMYQNLIDNLVQQGKAATTIKAMDSLIQVLMNDADKKDIIPKNKLKGISINGAKAPKSQTVETADYKKFMEAAEKKLTKYQLSIIYLTTIGIRRSELCGFRLKSFEFSTDKNGIETCAIKIDMSRTGTTPNGGPLKSKSAYRTNYVSGPLLEWIHYAVNESKQIKLKFGHPLQPNDFLFTNVKTGAPMHVDYMTGLFKGVSKLAGVKLSPHSFRHYFATVAQNDADISGTAVMHWLGHSNVNMTNSYTRGTKEGSLKVMNGMRQDLFDELPAFNKKD
ncbi:prophage P1 protein 1, integrase [Dellaglioa algida]|nr:prophage P1 protein 1, integrase [Dellaglioa algida]